MKYAERRVVGLKKRIEELRYELDTANAELEDAKRAKETAEQELKGYEVELTMNEASIQVLEVLFYFGFRVNLSLNFPSVRSSLGRINFNAIALNFFQARISLIQDEVSTIGYDVEALKVLVKLFFFFLCVCSLNLFFLIKLT